MFIARVPPVGPVSSLLRRCMLRPYALVGSGGISGAVLSALWRALLTPPRPAPAPLPVAHLLEDTCPPADPTVIDLLGALLALAPVGSGYLIAGLALVGLIFLVGFLVGCITGFLGCLAWTRCGRRALPARVASYGFRRL